MLDFSYLSRNNLTTEYYNPQGHRFDHYEIFSYPGDYVEEQDGKGYASQHLEVLQREQNVLELTGRVRGATPGFMFELRNHPRKEYNGELLITRAHYEVKDNDYEGAGESGEVDGAGESGEEAGASYRVVVDTLPLDHQFHPPLRTPKPRTRGPETAVVVGPEGSEIHTDQYGRVKVHFHWDRYGQKDGSDSCWIRVSYPWAGSNFGGIHIPRVGQEVIVDYERGDPDRPIITGRVFNEEQMPPWSLPDNKTQSGVLTRSTDGGYSQANAFRFEDKRGEEQVWLHAERNQDIEVEADETHWVGRNRTKTVDGNENNTIHMNRLSRIELNDTFSVGLNYGFTIGLVSAGWVGLISALNVCVLSMENAGVGIMKNAGVFHIDNTGALRSSNVGGVRMETTGLVKLEIVGGDRATIIKNNDTHAVTGASKHQADSIELAATTKLVLSCGGSSITLTPATLSALAALIVIG